ncbi:uncharacterized protein BDV17DRAFT_290885 [Aspergillus undulatus]|uniref:uncharacterized protein n=1 Tax=Aspergillus undulatus TaxID=1810928 RepID=UPI003CCD19DF
MPMIWNDQADAKLLVAIISTNDAKLNWSAIAEYMGPECSVSAVQHRIQRLKDNVKTKNPDLVASPEKGKGKGKGKVKPTDNSSNAAETGSASASPRKRGRPNKDIKIVTAGPGRQEVEIVGEDAELMKSAIKEAVEKGSPAKKVRGGSTGGSEVEGTQGLGRLKEVAAEVDMVKVEEEDEEFA